ncbi:hypothetical protein CBS147332_8309 [Penicillium roqueforti]|nr:hypothetical protein CBS147332_8309 [Penicillium roqueforti]KAI3099981.1 hypothetical protein CBS147331_8352 [Penicillium roqueforti]
MSLPTISRINPTSGPTTGGITAIISGTNLAGATTVTFGTVTAVPTSSTATTVSVVVPANTAGTVRVSVTTPNGTSTSIVNFTYVVAPLPSLTSLSPTSGSISGGNTVTLTGTNLGFVNSVTFGGTAATSVVALSNNTVAAVVPSTVTPGAVDVTVSDAAGNTSTLTGGYTYTTISAPTVTALNPNNGPATGGTLVAVTGTGFVNATAVTFGTTSALSYTIVSGTLINAVSPPGTGTTNVFVTNPGGTSAADTGNVWTWNPTPTPTVTSLSPVSGPLSGGNVVTVTGTNLTGTTSVTFGGVTAPFFVVLSSTALNATVPASTVAGTVDVVVTTPNGSSPINPGDQYTYIAGPAPTAVEPSADLISGGTQVAITGSGLTGTTSVLFGTIPGTAINVVSDSEVDVTTPSHAIGTVPITVTSTGGTNSSLTFTFEAPPIISSITPAFGSTAGGTAVSISGAGLSNTNEVLFGATPATAQAVISDNQLTATSPPGPAGLAPVTVVTDAAFSDAVPFTYLDAPTLAALSPTTGSRLGGNNVTLTGSGFTQATAVTFDTSGALFTVEDDGTITAVAPPHVALGAVPVTVTTPGGTSGPQTYTYT